MKSGQHGMAATTGSGERPLRGGAVGRGAKVGAGETVKPPAKAKSKTVPWRVKEVGERDGKGGGGGRVGPARGMPWRYGFGRGIFCHKRAIFMARCSHCNRSRNMPKYQLNVSTKMVQCSAFWVSCGQGTQTEPASILKRFNVRLDLKHGISERRIAESDPPHPGRNCLGSLRIPLAFAGQFFWRADSLPRLDRHQKMARLWNG